ncbi:Do family serine endopeptidase [endosymbiont of Pachyrhynchus infernalis]|uniref:Do family serine endopeptidase n=1 Tax=endosymbiont of Pachyrhynchus infernalis TaxID=1971488 RepID=UPI000DC70884|nr:Do family serine endopeptidase [endosymbiont of Pachyrhynchus infernalis]BBA84915.1 protease degQ [endosymbiont of Pachyrhynchus infernalis]
MYLIYNNFSKFIINNQLKFYMKLNLLLKILLIISNIFSTSIIHSYNNHKDNKNITFSLAPMLEKVIPSVVNIYTEGVKEKQYNIPKEFKYFFGPNIPKDNKLFEGIGSGVIIDSNKGYIITNNHVVKNVNKIKIRLNDGREFNAKLIGNDNRNDIAIIKFVNVPKNLVEIKIANSDLIRVGDFVVAIGNPFGLGQTATSGIISALGRSGLNSNGLENFIQTDASINKGNSGGALVNINGELIGINTAIIAPNGGNIGIGFAIPSNIIKNLSYQIIKFGEVKRNQLGIKCIELNPDISKAFNLSISKGIFISEVMYGSPAYKYDIKPGDIILSINDKEINNFSELKLKIGISLPGENLKVGILRNNITKYIYVKLDNLSLSDNEEKILISSLKGATFKNIVKDNINYIQVSDIIKGSIAYLIGLRKNDIIIELNKNKVYDLNQFKKILINSKNKLMSLSVIRNNSNVFLIFRK